MNKINTYQILLAKKNLVAHKTNRFTIQKYFIILVIKNKFSINQGVQL
jgi:hypothetical protein